MVDIFQLNFVTDMTTLVINQIKYQPSLINALVFFFSKPCLAFKAIGGRFVFFVTRVLLQFYFILHQLLFNITDNY